MTSQSFGLPGANDKIYLRLLNHEDFTFDAFDETYT